jgi:hypothetical protein
MICALLMLAASIIAAIPSGTQAADRKRYCKSPKNRASDPELCNMSDAAFFAEVSGGFGGFNQSLTIASLPPDQLGNEFISFCM